eukprot:5931555-Amphidinium_carterae.1
MQLGPLLLAQLMTWLGALLLALDPVELGPLLPLRSLGCVGSVLLVLDFLSFGAFVLLRSFARIGVAMLVLDLVVLDVSLPLHGSLQGSLAGTELLLSSPSQVGPMPSVFDLTQLGPLMLARSMTCLDVFLIVLDLVLCGFPLLLQSYARAGLVPPIPDLVHL